MIKILHLRAPSDLHRGQVEIKYRLPCTVFLRRRGRMWEEKAPAFRGSSGRWLWPGSEHRERGDPCTPELQLPAPPCAEHLSMVAAFSSLVQSLSLPFLSLPLPCCGSFFSRQLYSSQLFRTEHGEGDVSTLLRYFPSLPGMRGYCFLLEKCNQHTAQRPSHYVFDPLPWSLTHISFKHIGK